MASSPSEPAKPKADWRLVDQFALAIAPAVVASLKDNESVAKTIWELAEAIVDTRPEPGA